MKNEIENDTKCLDKGYLVLVGNYEDTTPVGIFASEELAEDQIRVIYDNDLYGGQDYKYDRDGVKIPYNKWRESHVSIHAFKLSTKVHKSHNEINEFEFDTQFDIQLRTNRIKKKGGSN